MQRKKILSVFLFLLIILTIAAVVRSLPRSTKTSSVTPKTVTNESLDIGIPKKIEIPSLGIDTAVDSVGLDSKGRMDVPTTWKNVAWYNLGPKPGEKGNVVIDGHNTSPNKSEAAAFERLEDVRAGDTISITDEGGRKYNYIVKQLNTYPYDQAPIEYIFGTSEEYRLNLITCSGTWSRSQDTFSQRLVVISELVR